MHGTMWRRRDERGSVVAEFAVAVPAVALVLAVCLDAVGIAATGVRLQDAAADAARGAGRGDDPAAVAAVIGSTVPGASVETRMDGDAVCVTVATTDRLAGIVEIPVAASSCALTGGR